MISVVRRLRMSAMEVTETPTAESEQIKEQIDEMHQQKVEETKKVVILNFRFLNFNDTSINRFDRQL